MAIEVRVAGAGDAALLAELGRATFLEAFARQIEHDSLTAFAGRRFGANQQAAELARPDAMFFIASHDGHIAGYAKLCQSVPPACINDRPVIELERLYLYAEWQGLGIARKLMNACMTEARDRSCGGMWLDVWDQNLRAQAFYQYFSFQFVSERPYVVGNETQRHLLMYRPLRDRTTGC